MKWYARYLAYGLLALFLLGSLPPASAAQGASSAVQGKLWTGQFWVEGVRVGLLDEQGSPVSPLEYNGTVYIPLRSAGEWMGCAVAWDQAAQTITLTRGSAPLVLEAKDLPVRTDAEQAVYDRRVERGVALQRRSNITVILEGAVQRFTNAAGADVYPMVFDDVTYLPVRSIGALMGLEVVWYKGPNIQDHMDGIQLYTAVTAEQRTQMQTYLDQCGSICSAFPVLIDQLRSDNVAQVQTAYSSVTMSLAQMEQLSKPDVDYFVRYQQFFDAALSRARSLVEESGEPSQKYEPLTFRLRIPQELSALQAEIPFIQGALDALADSVK